MAKYTRQKEKKPDVRKKILLGVIAALAVAITVAVLGFIVPYQNAKSSMPANGEFIIEQQAAGNLLLSWPAADQADYYCVEIYLPAASEDEEPEIVYKDFISDATSCILPELPAGVELTLRVSSAMEYHTLGSERIRFGERSMEVTEAFTTPEVSDFQWTADEETKTIHVTFSTLDGDHCRYYLLDENGEKVETRYPQGNEFTITFGDDGDYPMPEHGEEYHMAFDVYREEPGVKFYGYVSAEMTVTRNDLLGRDLNLVSADEGYNVCTLSWDETKGDHYEVQLKDENTQLWTTVATVGRDDERTYTSGHLAIYKDYAYRVVAVGGPTMEGSEYAAVSEEVTFETHESPIYATIWPVNDLKAYKDPQKTEEVGQVKTGTAFCVLEETDGMFGIRLNGEMAYIDSNYCMINLPEYIGDLCKYKITNSYSSIYMVHEFEIPKVTGVVTAGYEQVQLDDGDFLVPLLYPTAKKLVTAAESAVEQGYRLKIYDAFRPNKATREIYDITNSLLDNELPENTYTGVKRSSLNLPAAKTVELEDGITKESLTYRMVMTGDKYTLNYFLAKGGSLHNLGIALDLTLEDLTTGEELKMQTSMHDLSQYSVLSRNNAYANTLSSIMKSAGFGDLISEWWHFQDNDSRSQLSPPTVYGGVSAGCWMADDNGWKYRTNKGTYYQNTTATIDDVVYTFDGDGYVIET